MERLLTGVGLRQPNRSADVKLVQSLLNRHRPSSLARLVEDGVCGALTLNAIREFQARVLAVRDPDGVVSPDGPTFKALSGDSAPQPSTTDAAIEALELADVARRAAYDLKHRFPTLRFTSGRRSLVDQARAMAGNIVLNRQWIVQTYVDSPASRACQSWVNTHPQATTKDAIAQGLLTTLQGLPASEAGRISKHLSGEAFDIQPVETDAEAIKAAARGLPGARFLEKEGGLVRWHVQF